MGLICLPDVIIDSINQYVTDNDKIKIFLILQEANLNLKLLNNIEISVNGIEFMDNDLKLASKLNNLEILKMSSTNNISSYGISWLRYMNQLKELSINISPNITDINLLSIPVTNIQILILNGSCHHLTNRSIEHISKMTNLKTLYLSESMITDFKPLSILSNLEKLYLKGKNINDDNLKLDFFSKMIKLCLYDTNITDYTGSKIGFFNVFGRALFKRKY